MQNRVQIDTKQVRFPVAEDLYGLFFEDINRAGDGGIYPEMLRNRSFEDSLLPAGCTTDDEQKIFRNRGGWPGAFNHGEGMDDWADKVPYTPIPGWYSENAEMSLCADDTLNARRERSLRVRFRQGGKIWNIGYAGVPIIKDSEYNMYLFIKAPTACQMTVSLENSARRTYAQAHADIFASSDWQRVDFSMTACGEDYRGQAVISVDRACEILIGFTSLMPAETYMGHGLRKDIVQFLKDSHPRFMRYPGGCIVEGFSLETAMRFSNTIGPVWERPSHNLMWHYRTTNGFGYHEFLQLCEDLDMEPMYVCNCGMSCQARVAEYFDEAEVDALLQEALGALEYALGPVDSHYGAMRAAAGHPAPFKLKYLEIGNENHGPEYLARYEKFYKALKSAYPDVIYISNSHTERDGLPTEMVDEHYYSAPEFFLENDNRFDSYDRSGPEIFLGEYAVNGGNTIASVECAIAEAVFLAGVERNQDIVKLTAYAPLFQNADYTAWKPNLIVFNNHQVYGIPSYHAIAMMAGSRGKEVLQSSAEGEMHPPVYQGVPGLLCQKPGLVFRNAKINGKPVAIKKTIYGGWSEEDGQTTMLQEDRPHIYTGKSEAWNKAFADFRSRGRFPGMPKESDMMWVAFDSDEKQEYTFEIDIRCDADNPFTLSVWNEHPETDAGCNEPKDPDWNLHSVRRQIWKIENGQGTTEEQTMYGMRDMPVQKTDLDIDYSRFNTYKIVANRFGYDCYINDRLVQKKVLELHPAVYAVATAEDDTVILKLVHVGTQTSDVTIQLDCDIDRKIDLEVLSGGLDEGNSFKHADNIVPRHSQLDCGAQTFQYAAPGSSISILKMKKKTAN